MNRKSDKMPSRLRIAGVAISLAILSAGCPSGGPVNEAGPVNMSTVSFANDIQPILTANCIVCHQPGGFAMTFNGIPMDLREGQAFASILNQQSSQNDSFTLVTPNDSSQSLLFRKVSEDNPPVGETMPFSGGRLSSENLALIRDWIDQGAMNN